MKRTVPRANPLRNASYRPGSSIVGTPALSRSTLVASTSTDTVSTPRSARQTAVVRPT